MANKCYMVLAKGLEPVIYSNVKKVFDSIENPSFKYHSICDGLRNEGVFRVSSGVLVKKVTIL